MSEKKRIPFTSPREKKKIRPIIPILQTLGPNLILSLLEYYQFKVGESKQTITKDVYGRFELDITKKIILVFRSIRITKRGNYFKYMPLKVRNVIVDTGSIPQLSTSFFVRLPLLIFLEKLEVEVNGYHHDTNVVFTNPTLKTVVLSGIYKTRGEREEMMLVEEGEEEEEEEGEVMYDLENLNVTPLSLMNFGECKNLRILHIKTLQMFEIQFKEGIFKLNSLRHLVLETVRYDSGLETLFMSNIRTFTFFGIHTRDVMNRRLGMDTQMSHSVIDNIPEENISIVKNSKLEFVNLVFYQVPSVSFVIELVKKSPNLKFLNLSHRFGSDPFKMIPICKRFGLDYYQKPKFYKEGILSKYPSFSDNRLFFPKFYEEESMEGTVEYREKTTQPYQFEQLFPFTPRPSHTRGAYSLWMSEISEFSEFYTDNQIGLIITEIGFILRARTGKRNLKHSSRKYLGTDESVVIVEFIVDNDKIVMTVVLPRQEKVEIESEEEG